MKRKLLIGLVAGAVCCGAVACEKEGPAERAGEQIDEAVEETGEKAREAVEKAGEKMEELGDKAKDATE